MKKLVSGLVGILLMIAPGCMVHQANEDVDKIRYHVSSIKKIIGAGPNDSYNISDKKKKGLPFEVTIIGKNSSYVKQVMYLDTDGDGKYDRTELNSLEIPGGLKLRIIPTPKKLFPAPEKPIPVPKQYNPEKKKPAKKEYVVIK